MSDVKLRWRDDAGETREIDVVDKAFVGRVCAGVDRSRAVVLNDPNVSRDHFVVERVANAVVLKDTSRNGTWLNGVRVSQGAERHLEDGDVIRAGQVDVSVMIDRGAESAESADEGDQDISAWTTVSPVYQHVTNVVADLRGFTSLSETLPAEQMLVVMNAVFKAFSDLVVAHHGTLKDYAGDAIFAFWEHGTAASADKARLACAAAVAQLEALPRIAAELSRTIPTVAELRVGWGITTGLVTVSQYGARATDLAVLGDSTNVAFRISGMASSSIAAPIVVDEKTKELLDDAFATTPIGEHEIKGKRRPVALYEIVT